MTDIFKTFKIKTQADMKIWLSNQNFCRSAMLNLKSV